MKVVHFITAHVTMVEPLPSLESLRPSKNVKLPSPRKFSVCILICFVIHVLMGLCRLFLVLFHQKKSNIFLLDS